MTDSFILISGSSTGIGRALALRLAAEGHTVLAGVRSQADGEALVSASGPAASHRLQPVLLDVTREDSIRSAVEHARELAGPSGLRAVVNNAGIVVPGPVEFVPSSEWRRQFDVNFFGMIELTRATLPLLRQAVRRLGSGVPRLMFVSSIGGRVAQPILAPYTCSKFATTALGDSLRIELRRQGIGVTTVEPGAIATPLWGKGNDSARAFGPDHPARKLYNAELEGVARAAQQSASRATTAEHAAAEMTRALFTRTAPARLLIGQDAKMVAALRHWLPLSWFENLLLRQFGVAQAPALLPAALADAALPEPRS